MSLPKKNFGNGILTCMCGSEAYWERFYSFDPVSVMVKCTQCNRTVTGKGKLDTIGKWNSEILRILDNAHSATLR